MAKISARRNQTVAIVVGAVVAGMVGLSYAAVPLYQLFCQVTGYAGTTQVAKTSSDIPVLERRITVTFDANVAPDLAWTFKPVQKNLTVQVGKETLAFYEARNDTAEVITGTATFNVTPYKIGQYFAKVDCFCFTEQTLQPGQVVSMPVSFFIDPEITKDKNAYDIHDIILSYTFFRSDKNPEETIKGPKEKIANSAAGAAKISKEPPQQPDHS